MTSIGAASPHPCRDFRITLYILMKGPSLDWTKDIQLYDHFKAWRKRVDMLMTGTALKKAPQIHLPLW